jgi:HEAT repeat protein
MLGKIGADAVPVLVDALADKHVDVRQSAAGALTPLRISDKMVVLALAHAVHDPDPGVRKQCLFALQILGIGAKLAAPKLIAALKDSDGPIRVEILRVLQGLGESEHVLPVAAELLRDPSAGVRLQAVILLATQGNGALPHLILALRDSDMSVRFSAVAAVQRIPGDIKDALPALVALLGEGKNVQRRQVVLALGRVGAAAVPNLLPLLKDNDQLVRSAAVSALQSVGPDARKTVPVLSEMVLQDPYLVARRGAVAAIAAIDPDKLTDVFTLVKKHNDEKVRLSAYQGVYLKFGKKAATGLSAKQAVPIFIDATKDTSANIRLMSAQALASYGPAALDGIPALTALLGDADQRVRQQAQFALDQIKPK